MSNWLIILLGWISWINFFLWNYLLNIFIDKTQSNCDRLKIGLQYSLCRCFGQIGLFYMETCRWNPVNVFPVWESIITSITLLVWIITLMGQQFAFSVLYLICLQVAFSASTLIFKFWKWPQRRKYKHS